MGQIPINHTKHLCLQQFYIVSFIVALWPPRHCLYFRAGLQMMIIKSDVPKLKMNKQKNVTEKENEAG